MKYLNQMTGKADMNKARFEFSLFSPKGSDKILTIGIKNVKTGAPPNLPDGAFEEFGDLDDLYQTIGWCMNSRVLFKWTMNAESGSFGTAITFPYE